MGAYTCGIRLADEIDPHLKRALLPDLQFVNNGQNLPNLTLPREIRHKGGPTYAARLGIRAVTIGAL
jgi:hypothetical protein